MKTMLLIATAAFIFIMVSVYLKNSEKRILENTKYEIEKITYKKNGFTSGSMYHNAVKISEYGTDKYKIIYSDTTLSNNTGIDSIEISIYPIINKIK